MKIIDQDSQNFIYESANHTVKNLKINELYKLIYSDSEYFCKEDQKTYNSILSAFIMQIPEYYNLSKNTTYDPEPPSYFKEIITEDNE